MTSTPHKHPSQMVRIKTVERYVLEIPHRHLKYVVEECTKEPTF